MEKRLVLMAFIFILFISFISGCFDNKNNQENIVKIKGEKTEFANIMDAIEKSINGDVIVVGKGTYHEKLKITKSITLLGENKETTIIDAGGSGDGVYINADSVKISGFTIKNCGKNSYPSYDAAIDIRSNNNLISDNNIIDNGNNGFYIQRGSNNTFLNNLVYNNTFGVYADGSFAYKILGLNISNNIFSKNLDKGIYFSYCYNSTLHDNNISKNDYGIHMQHSDNNIIFNNFFNKNERGLFFCCGAENNIVFKNEFVDNSEYNAKSNYKNQFDYLGIGNFWDDYNGTDENSDGIGDTPYDIYHHEDIDIFNLDRYPLVNRNMLSN